ncbi:MAG TPA: DUF4129 domain-containing protein [Puia sp.]|nr:DUF4129 domain-containing protein [Puia sp.]
MLINCVAAKAQNADTVTVTDTIKTSTNSAENSTDENNSSKNDTTGAEPIVMRAVPDSVVENLKRSKDFEYANDAAYLAKEPLSRSTPGNSFWNVLTGKIAQIFVYTLLIGVLLFAFYKIIVDNKLYLFYSKPKKTAAAQKNESDDEIPENIDEKIRETLLAKNYRLAVRYMHLKALKLLDEKEWIRFHAQATNHYYASQLKTTAFGKDFQQLTNVYEYVWFGDFKLTEQQADIVQQNFNRFYSEINN